MPLTALVRQLEQVPLTGEVLERASRSERLRLPRLPLDAAVRDRAKSVIDASMKIRPAVAR